MYTNSFNCFFFTMEMESFLCEEGSDFIGVFAKKKNSENDYEFIMSVHLSAWNSATFSNKCTVISQIITLLHVSTLSYHSQRTCK